VEDAAEVVDDDDDFFELPPQPASSPTAATSATSAPRTFPRVLRPEMLIGCIYLSSTDCDVSGAPRRSANRCFATYRSD
jgi:hypothetical protein